MPCLIAIFALIGPRVALVFTAIFSDMISRAIDPWWVAFLGFLFLPWTTLAWSLAYQPHTGVTGFGWFVVIFAFVVDLSSYGAASQSRRRNAATA